MYKWNKIHCYFYYPGRHSLALILKWFRSREKRQRQRTTELIPPHCLTEFFLYSEIWFITENELLSCCFSFAPGVLWQSWPHFGQRLSDFCPVTPGCCVGVKLSFPTMWAAPVSCRWDLGRALVLRGRSGWKLVGFKIEKDISILSFIDVQMFLFFQSFIHLALN